MALAQSRILSVPRSDAEHDSSILLHISQNGQQPLDIRLIGTEGSNPYVGTIKHGRCEKLRAKNYTGDQDEWEITLSKIFLGTLPEDDTKARALDGLEVVASVSDAEEIIITIRRNIKGITQRLGTVSLPYEETQEIELFDWTAAAARAAASTEDRIVPLEGKFKSQEETINKLNHQLEEFIRVKKEHEDALFEKFRELLNSKKLKIRDQQRLLNAAKLDPETVARVQSARETAAPRKASTSRTSKRKAGAGDTSATLGTVSNSEDDEFEKMDLDGNDRRDSNSEQETPDGSDETTDEEDPSAPIESASKQTQRNGQLPESNEPPPPRELPFAQRPPTRHDGGLDDQNIKEGDRADETEDDTDDDEL
ncbi:MAG: hypothetical protein M1837_001560 [Sclerophora amabilis]|nr:MAG: hypothetical protein M1837_001560 [Sclerophora amabilis]